MSICRKIRENRVMLGKLKYETQVELAAAKIAEGQKVEFKLPKAKNSPTAKHPGKRPAKVLAFENAIEEAKLERKRRAERDKKRKSNVTIENKGSNDE